MKRRTYLKHSGWVLGGMVFSGAVISAFKSCKWDESTDWTPRFFSQKEAKLVAETAECIIPRTETPGAKDMMVERRIDEILYSNYEASDQQIFRSGLAYIDELCIRKYKKGFVDIDWERQNEIFAILSEEAKVQRGKHIYPFLKGLTVMAYFTSEVVCQEVLLYDPVPGRFDGCVPYIEINGIWGLQ